jgi:HemY protein
MRPYRGLLVLLALAVLGALGWHRLAADPGYLLLSFGGWSVETTLIVALAALVLTVALLYVAIGLVRAPLRWWRRGRRRAARERLANGLMAIQEGHWLRAEKSLRKAALQRDMRLPALLLASQAARERGAEAQANALLEEAALGGHAIAAALPGAERLLAEGRAATACELLHGLAHQGPLPPRALELQARALAACGRADEAVEMLPQLRRAKVREGAAWQRLEQQLLSDWLQQADSRTELERRWATLDRVQRAEATVVSGFAIRGATLGASDAAAEAIERSLDRNGWNPGLVRLFGELSHSDHGAALRTAEGWLARHPDDPDTLLCLGRLCRQDQLWGKAEAYLGRALALGVATPGWETLAEVFAEQGDDARARQAYSNAMATTRGQAPRPVLRLAKPADDGAVPELRSSMGVPRLPAL